MDFIANIIGVSTAQLQMFIGAALLAIVVGLVLRFLWKFLLVGAVAIVAAAFVHERVQLMTVPIAVAAPATAEISPSAELPGDEKAFLDSCISEGENNRQECVGLWAEKQYIDQDDKAAPQRASSAAN